MQKSCTQCSQLFSITDEDLQFLEKVSPIFSGKKYQIPPPTLCPECRQQRRLAANNEMKLYSRKCDFTGEPVLAVFAPDSPYKVYKLPIWWDKSKWNPLDYGRDFDFSRPFFEQFEELSLEVPHESLTTAISTNENSEYINWAAYNKDCYLIMHADGNKDCMYGYGVKHDEGCVDVLNSFNSQLLYECIDCRECYNLAFSQNCTNCTDSYFLKDCSSCKNCFGCKNLNHKEYYVFNKHISKEEYEDFLQKNDLRKHSVVEEMKVQFSSFEKTLPQKNLQMLQTEESFGDQLTNCKNVQNSFGVSEGENLKYVYQSYYNTKDVMDLYQFGNNSELLYDSAGIGHDCYNVLFSNVCCVNIKECLYSYECMSCEYIFGCVCLEKAKYCIFNKQYTKEEYEILVPKIIAHMMKTEEYGEFFPIAISTFAYNETRAMDYFPLSKEEVLANGWRWRDEVTVNGKVSESSIPDSIDVVPEDILKEVLSCVSCRKPYRIVSRELAVYKKRGLPIPHKCFFCRHSDRLSKKNPQKIWDRACMKCGVKIKTTYAPARSEIVYCESCYQREVY